MERYGAIESALRAEIVELEQALDAAHKRIGDLDYELHHKWESDTFCDEKVGGKIGYVPYIPLAKRLEQQLADAQATVEALQAQLKTARYDAVRAFVRGEDKMCFVCGAKEPCELKDDPSSPCTFDPTPMELKQQVEALQRERDEAIREHGKESGFWGRSCARLLDKRDELQAALTPVEGGQDE